MINSQLILSNSTINVEILQHGNENAWEFSYLWKFQHGNGLKYKFWKQNLVSNLILLSFYSGTS